MSKDDKGGVGRLWSGLTQRRESATENVFQMERQPAASAADDRAYSAFKACDKPDTLEIIRAADPSRFPAYGSYLDMSYDRFHDAAFSIIYAHMVVTVRGRNLAGVAHAVRSKTCERITEYSKREYDPPGKNDPLIESIEIVAADEQLTKESREK